MKKLFVTFAFGILSSTVMAEYVCERLNGCELFPEAKTQVEYCPTCIWVGEKKEVVTSTPSTRSENKNHEHTVCDHWNPITSEKPLVCQVLSSN